MKVSCKWRRANSNLLLDTYIDAIAQHTSYFERGDSFAEFPVLYVLGRETKWETQSFHGFSQQVAPPIKVTHLRLMDGDGNQMVGRLSTRIAELGEELERGRIIRLDLFTELTLRLNENTANMPCVFILKYSKLGYKSMPPVKPKDPISCSTNLSTANKSRKSNNNVDRSDAPVDCNSANRYCSMHGTSFIVCVCESIPVEKRDLAAIKEDCYFAEDELGEMTNPHIRNMIYWWYATNVYSICGKKKRKELPKCLVHKIRQVFPSDEYAGYEMTCNMHNN